MVHQKVRIRFRKTGDLRLVSHHDLMRCFERMLRRAQVPFRSTQGFNPKPRVVFALSLGLGVAGLREVVEIELDPPGMSPGLLAGRLADQAPPGLDILEVRAVDPRASAQPCRACYRILVDHERRPGLAERAAALLAAEHLWVERSRPQPRRLDARPYLRDLRVDDSGQFDIELLVTPTGSARPDEILDLLGLGDLLAAGQLLERTDLVLRDELEADAAPQVPGSEPLTC